MILRAMVRFANLREIGERLGRTEMSVRRRLLRLGLRASDFRVASRVCKERMWTEREMRVLRENAGKKTSKEIAEMLVGRSGDAVRARASLMGIVLQKGAWMRWEMDKLLEMREGGMSWREIGERLGRTWGSCRKKYDYLMKP